MIVTRLGNGWYDFTKIPQERRYIKICALSCGTDRKAVNTARKILGIKDAKIEIEEIGGDSN